MHFCRAIHHEETPHKYGMSWTTHRTGSVEEGGNFYLAKYGIRIQSTTNTFVLWQPKMAHGTSLQRVTPGDINPPNFRQYGLSIVTSNRMKLAWENYVKSSCTKIPDLSSDHEE